MCGNTGLLGSTHLNKLDTNLSHNTVHVRECLIDWFMLANEGQNVQHKWGNVVIIVSQHLKQLVDDVLVHKMGRKHKAEHKQQSQSSLSSYFRIKAKFLNNRSIINSFIHNLDQDLDTRNKQIDTTNNVLKNKAQF